MIFRCLRLSLVSGLPSVSSSNALSQACKAPNGLVPALTPLDACTGMLYCNLPHMQAKQGDRVRLHLFSLGTENGIHAPSISASTLDWEARTFPARSALCKTSRVVPAYGLTCRRTLHPSALLSRYPWIGSILRGVTGSYTCYRLPGCV